LTLPVRGFTSLERRLTAFHRPHVDRHLRASSPISSGLSTRDVSVDGFIAPLNALVDQPSSFWRIDRCIRMEEAVDGYRSRLFHVGVFARAIDLEGRFRNPARDPRFQALQRATLMQFFTLLDRLGLNRARLHATYFGGATVGGHPDGRDRLLTRRYRMAADDNSRRFLHEQHIDAVAITAMAGLSLQPHAGSLVGPRVEVFFDDVEFATIIFPCFRVRQGALAPINYMAAYGVGLERLMAVTSGRNFLHCVPRYEYARKLIERRIRAARSPLLLRDVAQVIFGIEALATLPARLSPADRPRVLALKRDLKFYILNLGLTYTDVRALFRWFASANEAGARRGDSPRPSG
jgi:hypothetical protein